MRNPECRAALVTIFKLILAASPALSLLPAFPPQRRDRENADCIGGALIDRRRGRRGGHGRRGARGLGRAREGEEGAGKRKGGGRGSGKTGKGVGKRKRGSEEEKREVGRANGAEDTRKREWKKRNVQIRSRHEIFFFFFFCKISLEIFENANPCGGSKVCKVAHKRRGKNEREVNTGAKRAAGERDATGQRAGRGGRGQGGRSLRQARRRWGHLKALN